MFITTPVKLEYYHKYTTESSFDNSMRFAHCRKVDNGSYKQIGNTEARCRDFLLDVVLYDYAPYFFEQTLSIYKFSWKPDGYTQKTNRTRISVYKARVLTEKIIPDVIEFLNDIEEAAGLKIKTKVFKTDNSDRIIFIADKAWTDASPLTSLYTLLIQLATQYYAAFTRTNNVKKLKLEDILKHRVGIVSFKQWNSVCDNPMKEDIVHFLLRNRKEIFTVDNLEKTLRSRALDVVHDGAGIKTFILNTISPTQYKNHFFNKEWCDNLRGML